MHAERGRVEEEVVMERGQRDAGRSCGGRKRAVDEWTQRTFTARELSGVNEKKRVEGGRRWR